MFTPYIFVLILLEKGLFLTYQKEKGGFDLCLVLVPTPFPLWKFVGFTYVFLVMEDAKFTYSLFYSPLTLPPFWLLFLYCITFPSSEQQRFVGMGSLS